ncbi:carboxylesterase family protein [Staphylococcus chromogenes]|uniref:carboxylesterase family protein n=1 Tax=Staphylococcus chromogenes TaxID=46126 RepID=UPI000D03270B|nr:carboxylesterase family protein [Staphylococcus chromogenes]MCE4971461.1 carboxylesterase family protein [Staphylococcus chromogenes]MCE5043834.1 carboxylesterase family protein [Staphylococcus chromogenes]MDT0672472.1 carboxylesterase family protein [Staphylococcus chromogenes]MDT0741225.1 carboxylesterase family protein [Staphylococcus chromogenes]MDU0481782.1 carboxylesterase family protein [Staphylococcus chromogenes]
MDKQHVLIQTRMGKVKGLENAKTQKFLGIRYAYAARYEAPQPYHYETEEIDATQHAPIAWQSHSQFESFYLGTEYDTIQQTEFPHYLSITRPKEKQQLLPVMVWIHGGSFVNGSGENPEYDPSPLVIQENVIVVNLSYRLGVLGFLRNQQGELANLGLLDQIEALKWIQSHIEDFGGDPSNITIFGQSAGGESVRALMLAEGTEHLFHRAIIQSAPLGLMKGRDPMTRYMLDHLKNLALDADIAQIKALQTQLTSHNKGKGLTKLMPFGPNYGIYPLPKEKEIPQILKQRAKHYDLLIGHTKREVNVFIYMNNFYRKLSEMPIFKWFISGVVYGLTQIIYAKPSYAFYKAYKKNKGNAYFYQFNWLTRDYFFAAGHSSELALLFDVAPYMKSPLYAQLSEEKIVSSGQTMKKVWGDFAKTGTIQISTNRNILDIKSSSQTKR